MTKNLITFLPITDLSKEKEYVYFGAVNGKIQNFLNYRKFNFSYGFTKNTKKERMDALKYCESFTDKIIQSLAKSLNMIHGTQYSTKIWKIIFGRWLKDFIYICYFNFTHLEKLNSDYNFEKIFSLKYLDQEFVTNNSNSLVCLYLTPQWNSKLSTKILEFIGKKNYIKYLSDKNLTKNIVIKKQKNNNKIFKILKNFFLLFNYFFNKQKNFFFFQSGLGFLFEKKIELKLNQIPSYWQFPTLKNEKYEFDEKMRKKIICELNVSNNFEKFLIKNIHLFLPTYVIEEFKNINQEVDSMTLPKSTKLIVTGVGFVNEYFNIFAAKKMLQNSKYINLQHGNSYHTHYANDFVFENSDLDSMITWGPVLKKKHKPLFNTNVLNQKNISNKNGQNLTIICNQLTSRPLPYDLFLNKERNFLETIKFANSLNDDIKKKTFFRLFPANVNDFNNNLKKSIKANNLNFYEDQLTYKEVIRNTKICLFNYESTGFYENLILNVPSIYYCTDNFIDLKEDVIKDYELLVEAKIIFKDKLKLINHLNEIWDSPSVWWNNPKTKEQINNFNFKYNRTPNNAIERLSNCLKNLI